MYYEINVSRHGVHVFATHERSVKNSVECAALMHVLVQKFPKAEGYAIDVSRWTHTGEPVEYTESPEGVVCVCN